MVGVVALAAAGAALTPFFAVQVAGRRGRAAGRAVPRRPRRPGLAVALARRRAPPGDRGPPGGARVDRHRVLRADPDRARVPAHLRVRDGPVRHVGADHRDDRRRRAARGGRDPAGGDRGRARRPRPPALRAGAARRSWRWSAAACWRSIVVVAARPIVVLLGGEEFAPAASVLRLQAPVVLTIFLVYAWTTFLIADGHRRALVRCMLIGLAALFVAGVPLIAQLDAEGAALAAVAADVVLTARDLPRRAARRRRPRGGRAAATSCGTRSRWRPAEAWRSPCSPWRPPSWPRAPPPSPSPAPRSRCGSMPPELTDAAAAPLISRAAREPGGWPRRARVARGLDSRRAHGSPSARGGPGSCDDPPQRLHDLRPGQVRAGRQQALAVRLAAALEHLDEAVRHGVDVAERHGHPAVAGLDQLAQLVAARAHRRDARPRSSRAAACGTRSRTRGGRDGSRRSSRPPAASSPARSYGIAVSLKNTSRSSAPRRRASARAASRLARCSGPSPPRANMNTSRTRGQRSAALTVAATAVTGSSQFQMPPFQSTIWASSPSAGRRARGPAPSTRRGGSDGMPNGTRSRNVRNDGSAAYAAGWIRREASSAPRYRSRWRLPLQMK